MVNLVIGISLVAGCLIFHVFLKEFMKKGKICKA